MNTQLYHLVVFVACIISLTVIVITGHDNSPLVQQLAGGIFGGVLGGSAAGAAPLLTKLLSVSPDDDLPKQNSQAGFLTLRIVPVLVFACVIGLMLAAPGCAALKSATTTDPVATACASSSVAIKTLTAAAQAHALSAADGADVVQAIAIVSPVCEATPEPSPTGAALTTLLTATTTLSTVAAKYATP